jgi:NitT/TauT family transport system substrate-binding protein
VKLPKRFAILAVAALAAVATAAFGVAASSGSAKKDKVILQLKWVTQAQFGGYYAAKAKGFYDQAGLDVTIRPGGPDIIPEQIVLGGQAQFGIDWLPSLLATRDKGGSIVNIAQVFTRSGTTEVVWKDEGITSFCQLKGRKVGVWTGGNEFEQFAALTKCGVDPNNKSQVTIVAQPFSMDLFLKRQVDAASAETYNELGQILEAKNPKTGKLYTLNDLRVFKYNDLGTGMLQDGLFVKSDYLKDPKNRDIAKRFVEASLKGWMYCRDHLQECTNIVIKNGPTLGHGHQLWQMNEINALIWPAPLGIGVMDPASFKRTADISLKYKIIKKQPAGAYDTSIVKAALADLKKQRLEVVDSGWQKPAVTVTPGGK